MLNWNSFSCAFFWGDRKLMILWWLVKMSATSSYYEKHSISHIVAKIFCWKSELRCGFLSLFLLLWPNVEKCNNCNLQKPTTRGGFGRNAYWLQLEQAMKMHCNETLYLLLHPEKKSHTPQSFLHYIMYFVCVQEK